MVSMNLALDRRVRDTNGHMHVADCVITRGIVSQYLARELDGAVERGYDPNDLVPVYRDPSELKLGLDSFKDIPLMGMHVVSTAENPEKEHIIGTISNPRMVGDDMRGDLTFWSAHDGIDLVLSETKDNLSAGYGFELDWTSGEHNGLHYVARMHTINANHVALVDRGRVPGARVADQKPSEPVMTKVSKYSKFLTALAAVFSLKPEQVTALDTALNDDVGGTEEIIEPVVDVAAVAEAERLAAEKIAADEANAKAAIEADKKQAVDEAVATVHALYKARDAVSSKVGVTALDSAEATYRFALDKSGVTHAAIVADALPALWEATNKLVAQDAAPLLIDVPNVFNTHIRKG